MGSVALWLVELAGSLSREAARLGKLMLRRIGAREAGVTDFRRGRDLRAGADLRGAPDRVEQAGEWLKQVFEAAGVRFTDGGGVEPPEKQ